jgi:hypothetical protein
LDIGLDGIILYDPEGYMAGKLAHIHEIIEEAGLYRVCRDGELMWLWKRQPALRWAIEWDGFLNPLGDARYRLTLAGGYLDEAER